MPALLPALRAVAGSEQGRQKRREFFVNHLRSMDFHEDPTIFQTTEKILKLLTSIRMKSHEHLSFEVKNKQSYPRRFPMTTSVGRTCNDAAMPFSNKGNPSLWHFLGWIEGNSSGKKSGLGLPRQRNWFLFYIGRNRSYPIDTDGILVIPAQRECT